MAENVPVRSHRRWILLGLFLALLVVAGLSILLGRYPEVGFLTPEQMRTDPLAAKLVLNLRMPRVLSALLLGMALSAAGIVFQMIFGNPLAEPGFLGVSQGAAFGTALCIILLGNSAVLVEIFSSGFGLLGLGASLLIARRTRFGGWVLRLILAGIVVSALFSAGVGLLKYVADPLSQMPEITFWLLGGLWSITWGKVLSITWIVLLCLIVLVLLRWRLNLLSLSDETSFSLGVAPGRERMLVLLAATVATAAVTSISGMIQWVGLIVPHIARLIFGADTRYTLPGGILLGGIFVLLCDDLARTLLPGEIPLGVLTAFIGAGIFLCLMVGQRLKVPKS